jgi:hypothetical protein
MQYSYQCVPFTAHSQRDYHKVRVLVNCVTACVLCSLQWRLNCFISRYVNISLCQEFATIANLLQRLKLG